MAITEKREEERDLRKIWGELPDLPCLPGLYFSENVFGLELILPGIFVGGGKGYWGWNLGSRTSQTLPLSDVILGPQLPPLLTFLLTQSLTKFAQASLSELI